VGQLQQQVSTSPIQVGEERPETAPGLSGVLGQLAFPHRRQG